MWPTRHFRVFALSIPTRSPPVPRSLLHCGPASNIPTPNFANNAKFRMGHPRNSGASCSNSCRTMSAGSAGPVKFPVQFCAQFLLTDSFLSVNLPRPAVSSICTLE